MTRGSPLLPPVSLYWRQHGKNGVLSCRSQTAKTLRWNTLVPLTHLDEKWIRGQGMKCLMMKPLDLRFNPSWHKQPCTHSLQYILISEPFKWLSCHSKPRTNKQTQKVRAIAAQTSPHIASGCLWVFFFRHFDPAQQHTFRQRQHVFFRLLLDVANIFALREIL